MDIYTLEWGKKVAKQIPVGLRVLDVGSLDINGSFREVLTSASEYIGIDTQEGKGVDFVLNANELTSKFEEKSFDVVVCMNTMEHDPYFWKTLEQINKVIKDDGWFFVGMPTITFPIHNHPDDYYRFTESAFRQVMMEGYDVVDLIELLTKPNEGRNGLNPVINCLGRKKQ